MAEYIEREAMVEASCERCNGEYVPCDKEHCLLMEVIYSIPAADVRPVVLCRDCQYFENDCGWCGYFDIGVNVNDFCSRGKREES